MEFINGVIFLKEVIVISFVGSCIVGVFLIITAAMMFGGARLFINGSHEFSDGKKALGVIVCFIGIGLSIFGAAFSAVIKCSLFLIIGGLRITQENMK